MKEYIPPTMIITSLDFSDVICTSDELPIKRSFSRSLSAGDTYDTNDNYFDNE